jgi:hypothetical protein
MTHSTLIALCSRWLLRHKFAVTAITECQVKCTSEVPDVLAFKPTGQSAMFEIKVDRSDFKADAKKSFRKKPDRGLGLYRYYVTPDNLVSPDEVPEGWGLLWFRESDGRCIQKLPSKKFLKRDHHAESAILVSALRRVGNLIKDGMAIGVSCKAYVVPTVGRTSIYVPEAKEDA